MKHRSKWGTLALVGVGLAQACHAGTMTDAAAVLPGDVMAAFFVGDLKKADADYRTVLDGMGLTQLIPEPYREPLARLKEKLPGLTGLDECGSIAILILKSSSLPEIMSNVVVLLPASDPARLLNDLGADPIKSEDDKVRSVLLFGQTVYAVATAKHVAVAKTAEVARRISQQKTTLRERLPAHEIESLEALDAAIWLDVSALIAIFKPQIDGLMGWALMMKMGAGEVGEEEARASKKQIDTVVEGLASLLIGATLSEQGVELRFTTSTKPESELAKQTQHVVAKAPLLRGLPRRNYLAVFGQELHPAMVQTTVSTGLNPVLADLRKQKGFSGAQVDAIQKDLAQAMDLVRAVRGSIDHLGAGEDGMIAASMILETSDSSAWLDLARKTGADIAALVVAEVEKEKKKVTEGEENEEWGLEQWLKWNPQAQQLEGVAIGQLFIDVSRDEELEPEDVEGITTVLGSEGLTIRLAAADSKNVAITLGGGSDQMARLIRAIRRGQSPLDGDSGIVRVMSALPKERTGVSFLALDRMVNFMHSAVEECHADEPFPLWLPQVDSPLAISITGGEGWSRYDVIAPMPLLAGIVTGVRTMESYNFEDDEEIDDEDADDDADDDEEEHEHPE